MQHQDEDLRVWFDALADDERARLMDTLGLGEQSALPDETAEERLALAIELLGNGPPARTN